MESSFAMYCVKHEKMCVFHTSPLGPYWSCGAGMKPITEEDMFSDYDRAMFAAMNAAFENPQAVEKPVENGASR